MSWDLSIIETGNGGDLQLNGNDLAVVFGIENMPYLGMFGGNVEQSTTTEKLSDAKDWWGNDLLMKSNPSIQFNSVVERTLNNTGLTSSGRVTIEEAIKKDLEFLAPQADIKVTVTITATDRIDINIRIGIDAVVKVVTANFKKISDGDWVISEFNDDFYL
jgi:hypothetical protein